MSEKPLSEQRMAAIRARLETQLEPDELSVVDQSHLHAGHAGAKSGKGHFEVRVVAKSFQGQPLLKRHRMIYSALGQLMESDIHALQIQALTPDET